MRSWFVFRTLVDDSHSVSVKCSCWLCWYDWKLISLLLVIKVNNDNIMKNISKLVRSCFCFVVNHKWNMADKTWRLSVVLVLGVSSNVYVFVCVPSYLFTCACFCHFNKNNETFLPPLQLAAYATQKAHHNHHKPGAHTHMHALNLVASLAAPVSFP